MRNEGSLERFNRVRDWNSNWLVNYLRYSLLYISKSPNAGAYHHELLSNFSCRLRPNHYSSISKMVKRTLIVAVVALTRAKTPKSVHSGKGP